MYKEFVIAADDAFNCWDYAASCCKFIDFTRPLNILLFLCIVLLLLFLSFVCYLYLQYMYVCMYLKKTTIVTFSPSIPSTSTHNTLLSLPGLTHTHGLVSSMFPQRLFRLSFYTTVYYSCNACLHRCSPLPKTHFPKPPPSLFLFGGMSFKLQPAETITKSFFLSLPLLISFLQNFSINRTETNHFVCGLFALSACLTHASYHPFIWPITMVARFCHKKI